MISSSLTRLNGRPGVYRCVQALRSELRPPRASMECPFSWPTAIPTHDPTACMDPVALNLSALCSGRQSSVALSSGAGRVRQRRISSPSASTTASTTVKTSARTITLPISDHFKPFYDFQAAGANVPGLAATVKQRASSNGIPSHTWTISNRLVNEVPFHLHARRTVDFQHPQTHRAVHGLMLRSARGVLLHWHFGFHRINNLIASFGNRSPARRNHTWSAADRTGVPFINISWRIHIGNNFEGELPRSETRFQWSDNLSMVKGNHTMKFGVDVRRTRFDQTLLLQRQRRIHLDSSGTNASSAIGDNYPGYLLGLARHLPQGSAQRENVRNTCVYLFAQDSWKIRPNLTLNYGLRWELDTPLDRLSCITCKPSGPVRQYDHLPLSRHPYDVADSWRWRQRDCCGVSPTGLVVARR